LRAKAGGTEIISTGSSASGLLQRAHAAGMAGQGADCGNFCLITAPLLFRQHDSCAGLPSRQAPGVQPYQNVFGIAAQEILEGGAGIG